MTISSEWQTALAYIQGKVPKQVYDTWFTPIHLERIEDSTAQLSVPNKFFSDWLSQHYGPLLAEAVSAARSACHSGTGDPDPHANHGAEDQRAVRREPWVHRRRSADRADTLSPAWPLNLSMQP